MPCERRFLDAVATTMLLAILLCNSITTIGEDFPALINTENPNAKLTTPEEALKGMKVPDEFDVTLFAVLSVTTFWSFPREFSRECMNTCPVWT